MSSTSPISSVTASSVTDMQNDPRTFFRQLAQAISTGDLSAAQKAYASITKLRGGALGNSTLGNDMNALGQALNSGDVSSAQQAFATLQADAQKLGHGHRHHHHRPEAASTTPPASSSTSVDPLLGTKLDVTI